MSKIKDAIADLMYRLLDGWGYTALIHTSIDGQVKFQSRNAYMYHVKMSEDPIQENGVPFRVPTGRFKVTTDDSEVQE